MTQWYRNQQNKGEKTMEKIFNGTSIVIGIAGGIATWIFGAWNGALVALIAIMAIDYITGVMKAVYTKTVSSEIGYKGLIKKIMVLAVVALANIIENVTGRSVAVREIVIMFFIANEGISILENAAVMLPKMPQKLKDILLQLRGDDEGDDTDDKT